MNANTETEGFTLARFGRFLGDNPIIPLVVLLLFAQLAVLVAPWLCELPMLVGQNLF